MIKLRQHQIEAIADVDSRKGNVLCVLPTGSGKCHGANTPILMFDGSIKMIQDVKIGDQLMGPDSKPRNVLSTTVGIGKLYKVTPVKGEPYVINDEHILSLKQTGLKSKPKYKCQEGKGKIVNIPVKEYLKKSKSFKHTHKGWRTGVNWEHKSINDEILPPYLLGVWLGDGTTTRPDITTADKEIENYVTEYAYKTGHTLRRSIKPNNKASTYHLSRGRILDEMKRLDLIGNKHIPDCYKTTDISTRLNVLAGLLDSDGYFSNNTYDIVLKVKTLADDLVFLARSLGFAAYITPCKKTCCNTGVTGDYFRISISGNLSIIPTKVERHSSLIRTQKKSVLVTGITISELDEDFYYGVTIDGDHLYLLGDFTVTHNSLTLADYARRYLNQGEITVVLAHRDVLISQLSEALCKTGVPHTFICSDKARRDITNRNLVKFGDSFYCETSPIIISSVPTFNARIRDNKLPQSFLESIQHWLMDETHHAVKDNQWGNVLESMVNADGIGFTATPIRGDKKGLGSHVDGYYDDMSVTCNTFDLIKAGMLSPYKVYCTGRIDTRGIKRDSDGDFNKKQLYIKTKEADIVGSAVDEYLKHLNGQPVIMFCINIEHAKEVAQQFNDRGIPSVAVSSKSSLHERESALKLFEEGRIKNLVNVDLFGEGYDCPAIAGVIMLRPTTSFSLYKQQFGRMLRLADGKAFGVLIDHVGNTQYMMHRFSLKHPHDDPQWTLDRLDDKSFKSEDEYDPISDLETMTCPECGFFGFVGEDFIDGVCPDCGHKETEGEKVARVRELKIQAGVLVELENSMIDELISKRSDMLKPVKEFANSLSPHFSARYAAINNHATRLSSLDVLRHYIQKWSEWHWKTSGKPGSIIQMDFESQFGVNVLIAQTQTANQMQQLTDRIKTDMRIRQWE